MTCRSTALLLFSLLVVGCLSAQQQPAPSTTTLQSQANLVVVPVLVHDKQGQHVSGLGKDDFVLDENGKPQRIASIEEIKTSTAPVEHAQPQQPNSFTNAVLSQQPKLVEILALDLLNTQFADQTAARRQLIKFLQSNVHADSVTAVVTFDRNGVHMLHDFSDDPKILIAALERVQSQRASIIEASETSSSAIRPTGSVDPTEASNASAVADESRRIAAILGLIADPVTAGIAEMTADNLSLQETVAASRENQSALITLECLQHLAQYFSGVPGRKLLVWVTSGFPYTSNSMPGEITGGVRSDFFDRTLQALNNANVAVYPVDARGVISAGSVPATVDHAQPLNTDIKERSRALADIESQARESASNPTGTLQTIATRTGGMLFHNQNDLSSGFRKAEQESSSYYLLSFYPQETSKAGWRKLKVQVARKESDVKYRETYYFSPEKLDTVAARKSEENVALASPIEYTQLPFTVAWQKIEPVGDKRKVQLGIFLTPGAVTPDSAHNNHISVDFVAVARNATNGAVAGRFAQVSDRDLPADAAQQVTQHGLGYQNVLELPPGNYDVRVVVRDNSTGKLGSVRAPLNAK